jgi:hypothetical protein
MLQISLIKFNCFIVKKMKEFLFLIVDILLGNSKSNITTHNGQLVFGLFREKELIEIICTVKLVCNDHPRDKNLWPLLTGGRCSEVDLC